MLNHIPKIKIIENVLPSDDIDIREKFWIQYYLNQNSVLLNENLVTPITINPNLDKILDGTFNLNNQDIDFLKISRFVKEKRKSVGLDQTQLAEKAGVALTVIRKIEQGKTNINLDKLLLVLKLFGATINVVKQSK